MAEVAHGTWAEKFRDRARWQRLADGLAVALAVALPWSTSATEILAGLWLIAFLPTLDLASLRRVVATPAGGVPVLLVLLGLIGVLWAFGVPVAERWDGVKSYYKFLFIPLLIVHFQRSERGRWVLIGFLISCGVLLALSWLMILFPSLPRLGSRQGSPGVPVKDYIAQSTEFTFCMFILAWIAWQAWGARRRWFAAALSVLALAFLANLFYAATSRTALIVVPVLVAVFALRHLTWKGIAAALLAAICVAGLAWTFAPPLRENVTKMIGEVREFRPEGKGTRAGERIEFWRKSVGFVAEAPFIGYGTGSIRDQFRKTVGPAGMAALASANPHNQTLAVAIQLGLLGTVVLFAMWLSHLLLFRGEGLVAWAGLVVVVQNIVGSLFNSHLFDFLQGWVYVVGVGVAAGVLLKGRKAS